MINFNLPPITGNEIKHMERALGNGKLCGDGEYTKKCNEWFEDKTSVKKALLTTSCTHALELTAILVEITEGDEVIMPSYTFVSTANAFVLRGAKIIFVDIRPDTMNIDEDKIEAAITERTKAIVPVHYAGISCNMSKICQLARKYNLYVIEDAAQGVMSTYQGQALGGIGDFGCFSFHETKNYSMGEGGTLLVKSPKHVQRAEIVREKGTNRSLFLRGQVDKYTWIDVGSSYLPSEINAAFLWGQLECANVIFENRMNTWNLYFEGLTGLAKRNYIDLPHIPNDCEHNAHMFYIKAKDIEERTALINYLKSKNITATFHYIPLHSAPAGVKYGEFVGDDVYTTRESERLLRLPLYYGIEVSKVQRVIKAIAMFYENRG